MCKGDDSRIISYNFRVLDYLFNFVKLFSIIVPI